MAGCGFHEALYLLLVHEAGLFLFLRTAGGELCLVYRDKALPGGIFKGGPEQERRKADGPCQAPFGHRFIERVNAAIVKILEPDVAQVRFNCRAVSFFIVGQCCLFYFAGLGPEPVSKVLINS